MQPLGSIAAVCAAVREEGGVEADRIAREAAREVERPVVPAHLPTGERETRLAAARRAAREKLAAEDLRDTTSALEAREQWIAKVVERAKQKLEEPARQERLRRLAQRAKARLPEGAILIALAPRDASLIEGAIADASITPGGIRVSTADGRLAIDETVEARARRLEHQWRAALGRIWG